MEKIVIAIDGPAGAGKSSIAKELSRLIGCIYIDTGAMYRAIGVSALEKGIDPKNAESVEAILNGIKMELALRQDGQHILINGEDVNGKIRTPKASMAASAVALIPAVRLKLVEIQRKIAETNSVVMDGRDIGTYVLPDADVKIFLTASAAERANRRYKELLEKGEKVTLAEVLSDMEKRDKQDAERSFAPLSQAADSVLFDNTGLDVSQSVEKIIEIIKKRTEK